MTLEMLLTMRRFIEDCSTLRMSTDAVEYCILWNDTVSFISVELIEECTHTKDEGRAPREGPLNPSFPFTQNPGISTQAACAIVTAFNNFLSSASDIEGCPLGNVSHRI